LHRWSTQGGAGVHWGGGEAKKIDGSGRAANAGPFPINGEKREKLLREGKVEQDEDQRVLVWSGREN